jgi:hypothetical protein
MTFPKQSYLWNQILQHRPLSLWTPCTYRGSNRDDEAHSKTQPDYTMYCNCEQGDMNIPSRLCYSLSRQICQRQPATATTPCIMCGAEAIDKRYILYNKAGRLQILTKKCSAVKGVKSGCTVKGIYGWWSEVRWSAVKWSEGPVKIGVLYLWINSIRNWVPLLFLYAFCFNLYCGGFMLFCSVCMRACVWVAFVIRVFVRVL